MNYLQHDLQFNSTFPIRVYIVP